jgi:hypothetical protein
VLSTFPSAAIFDLHLVNGGTRLLRVFLDANNLAAGGLGLGGLLNRRRSFLQRDFRALLVFLAFLFLGETGPGDAKGQGQRPPFLVRSAEGLFHAYRRRWSDRMASTSWRSFTLSIVDAESAK